MNWQEKWQTIIEPLLAGSPFEFIGVEQGGSGHHTLIRVYIDKLGGINIDDIAKLTRQINVVLDVESPVSGSYTLEVSSPGLDRPLFLPKHFQQQIGQKVSVKTRVAINNRHNFKGILQKAEQNEITLQVDEQTLTIAYSSIEKARVIPVIEIGTKGK
jgi:ribosome maturation factor RimP